MSTRISGPIKNSKLTRGSREWYSDMPLGNDPDSVVFIDDFFANPASTNNPQWTVVKDSGAAVALATDENNGAVLLTSTLTTDDDGASIQLTQETFKPATGVKIWFEAKIKASDADQHDMFVGLVENFATDPEACIATDVPRVGFHVADGSASIVCKNQLTDVLASSTASGVSGADDTYITLGFQIDERKQVKYFINRALVVTHSTTANIPNTELTPAVFNLSGNATGTHSLTCDYVWVLKDGR